jgi:hypothetical protein
LPGLLLLLAQVACVAAPPKADARSSGPAPSAQPSAADRAPAEFLPLAVGNAWTYEASGGGSTGQDTIRIVGVDGAWFLDDHRGRLRHEADGVRDRDRYLLRAPLLAGRSWTSVDQMVVQRFEVVTLDGEVEVPAGRFTRCAVVRNEQPLPDGARFVTEWTYAPGIGLAALRTFTRRAGQERLQTSLQLVRFQPSKE